MTNLEKKADLIVEKLKQKNTNKKVSLILSESKAQRCTPNEIEKIRQVFNTNPKVKDIYKISINNILKEVFPDNYYTKGQYGPEEMAGIYDLEQPGRSVINKLNTNYNCFCILLRDINKVLESENIEQIFFEDTNIWSQVNQVKKLVNFIDGFKDRIFNPDSSTFQSIMMVLGQTHAWGQKTEDKTIDILKNQFGNENVKPVGKLGSIEDMISGIDCEIIIDDIKNTAQIKPFTNILIEEGNVIVFGSGNVKPYKTDLIIFSKNNKEILIFKNKKTKIIDGNFVFPTDNLIYTLS